MTFRCTVENGRIVLPPDAGLPNGTEVNVQPVKARASKSTKKAPKPLPGFGLWKNRKDIGDSVEFLRKQRAKARRRRLNG